MTVTRQIIPLAHSPEATIRPPGSKSLTNRALLLAAMADGESLISGALDADDTTAMIGAVTAMGAEVREDWTTDRLTVVPRAQTLGDAAPVVHARLSGTTARFVLPAAAALGRPIVVDGAPPLRKRPIGHGLTVHAPGLVVAMPFVDLTIDALGAFGVQVERPDDATFVVARQPIRSVSYEVEPDATSASYFFAAAAITGGRITLDGLGTATRQGDMAFLDVLSQMGVHVERRAHETVVQGSDIHGIDIDLSEIPDTALTLAAVAVFADGPTRVRGVGYIRGHETDRVAAVVTELGRLGIEATETDDGFVVTPGPTRPASIRTYQDHRMAMSFSLIGLRAAGVTIEDPDVVAKTYPGFFEDLARLGSGPSSSDQ